MRVRLHHVGVTLGVGEFKYGLAQVVSENRISGYLVGDVKLIANGVLTNFRFDHTSTLHRNAVIPAESEDG